MPKSLGQIVYLFKDKLVNDVDRTDCHSLPMAQRAPRPPQHSPHERAKSVWSPPSRELMARTMAARIIAARENAGLTQEEMAGKLGMGQSPYSKYEKRGGKNIPSTMPHIYLERFCEVTCITLRDLLKDPR